MKDKIKHIAIIMDGNGRWALGKGFSTVTGHQHGAKAARKVLINCLKLNIPFLTLYTFSSENWHRNPKEVSDLMELLKFYLSNELNLLIEQNIRIKIIGDKTKLSSDIIELIDRCERETQDNTKLYLQIALSYGARDEIIIAQKKLFSDLISAKVKIEDLDEDLFENYLYTAGIPDPDLLIRTGGEYRISNFLLWQIAYSELYFTKVLWPDFNLTHLRKAMHSYYKRERRYGLSKQII